VATATDAAQWMLAQVRAEGILYQQVAVYEIMEQFGDEFIYYNANGNPAIVKDVLSEFRRLTGDSVVCSRSDRCWRLREEHDEAGRRQY